MCLVIGKRADDESREEKKIRKNGKRKREK